MSKGISVRGLGAALALIGACLVPAGVGAQDPSRIRKITFDRPDDAALEAMVESGRFEILHSEGDRIVALENLDETCSVDFRGSEVQAPDSAQIVLEDIDEELQSFARQGHEGAYHSVEESETELADWAARYPELCHLEPIGQTFEKRPIWALRIAKGPPEGKPRVLVMGVTHAREWISAEVPLAIIKTLLEGYESDERIGRLVDSTVLWVVPILNPDGLHYSQTHFEMWRKNRSKREKCGVGVDINRNFSVGWGKGASSKVTSEVYKGVKPDTEEEVLAIQALVERESIQVCLGFHSYGDVILYPWGYRKKKHPRLDVYEKHAKAMAELNGYTHEPASSMYIAGGANDDTFAEKYGCWSWTVELGEKFVPDESDIGPICEKNVAASLYLLEVSPELAATPVVERSSETLASELDSLEALWSENPMGAEGSDSEVLSQRLSRLAVACREDAGVLAEVERRASSPVMKRLYSSLLMQASSEE